MPAQPLPTEFDARPLRTVVDWPHGARIGSWQVLARLGCGGTAEAWHARSVDGREAALKLPLRKLRRNPAVNALLRREHDLLSGVDSAHLVRCHERLEHDGVVLLALEYLPHGDLVPLVGAAPRHWLPALRSVIAALHDLARHGLAHGDLKARNVLFAADGSARLADLTSARPLDAPAACATAAYALPPRRRGGARASEADCFALAVLIYELVTGRLPYGPDGPADGEPPPSAGDLDEPAARLLAGAVAALRAGGRGAGLSYFSDVLESVRSADG